MNQDDRIELGEAIKKSYRVEPLKVDLVSRVTATVYQKEPAYISERWMLYGVLFIGVLVIGYSLWVLIPLLKITSILVIAILSGFCALSVKEFNILLKRTQVMT